MFVAWFSFLFPSVLRCNSSEFLGNKSTYLLTYLLRKTCEHTTFFAVPLSVHINRLSGLPTLEHATYNCQWEKQSVFISIPHYSNDRPWALLMVIANQTFPVSPSSFIYPPIFFLLVFFLVFNFFSFFSLFCFLFFFIFYFYSFFIFIFF